VKVILISSYLFKGGAADLDTAARMVLQDWNNGKLKYYTVPQTQDEKM
jgi:nuclear GTP-binding protein